MAAPNQTVCAPWAAEDDLEDCDLQGLEVAAVLAKMEAASDLLWRMSGRQWRGECTTTIRPCGTVPVDTPGRAVIRMMGGDWWVPGTVAATLAVNCLGGGACGCLSLRQVKLPGGPVSAVTEVKIDGTVLAPTSYRVDSWEFLVRTDGGVWPCCQQLHLDDTEAGTWSVTYTHGVAPPPSGVAAAVALAVQLAAACAPDGAGDCRLPAKVVSASRRGLDFELEPADLMSDGRTGIEAVDLFLLAVNPERLRHGSSVRSPDVPRHRVAGT